MSLTFTSQTANEGNFVPTFNTASVTMAAGSVCLMVIVWTDTAAGPVPTATGLTFDLVVHGTNGVDRDIALYRALIPGGGFTGAITVNPGQIVVYYDVVEVAGALTTGTNASDAIVQSQGFADGSPANPYTKNYTSGFASGSNGGYAAFGMKSGDLHPFTPRTGWTKGAEGTLDCDFWRSSSDTAAGFTATVGPSDLVGIMVEVAVPGGGGGGLPVADDTWPDVLGRPQPLSPTVTVFA